MEKYSSKDLLTPYGNRLMVAPIVNAANYEYLYFDLLSIACHALSLSATATLICISYLTTMFYLPEELRAQFGVSLNTVHMAVGIGPNDQLLEDIGQALSVI